jgi:hypothetical protein
MNVLSSCSSMENKTLRHQIVSRPSRWSFHNFAYKNNVLRSCSWLNGTLDQGSWYKNVMTRCKFYNIDFSRLHYFTRETYAHCLFQKCTGNPDWTDCTIKKTTFNSCRFYRWRSENTRWIQCDFNDTVIEEALIDEKSTFTDCRMKGLTIRRSIAIPSRVKQTLLALGVTFDDEK